MAQPYTKLGWTSGAPPQINGPNLDKMDQGILLASAPLVTQLPANPVDGQECNFLADAANGVVWHLVYRAADTSGHRWLFTGGSPLSAETIAAASTPSNAYVYVAGQPSIALPLAGDYILTYGAQVTSGSGLLSPNGAGIVASDNFAALEATVGGNSTPSRTVRFNNVTAAAVQLMARVTSGTAQWSNARMFAQPVRVG